MPFRVTACCCGDERCSPATRRAGRSCGWNAARLQSQGLPSRICVSTCLQRMRRPRMAEGSEMMTVVELQLVGGLGLQYAPGAEAGLLDAALDPIFNDAWQAFVATFPGMTLVPLFDDLPVEQLADLVDEIGRAS